MIGIIIDVNIFLMVDDFQLSYYLYNEKKKEKK